MNVNWTNFVGLSDESYREHIHSAVCLHSSVVVSFRLSECRPSRKAQIKPGLKQ